MINAINIIQVNPQALIAHPLSAQIFGQLEIEQFEDLKIDISVRGLRYPIELDIHNRVICGSQRMRAVQALGWTECPAVIRKELVDEESIREWLIKDNTLRRQLTPGQVYRAGQELERIESVKAERRMKEGGKKKPLDNTEDKVASVDARGKTTDKVARELGTSTATYERVKKIYQSDDDKLKEQVDKGFISISAAAKKVTKPPRQAESIPEEDNRSLAIKYARWETGVDRFEEWLVVNPPSKYDLFTEKGIERLKRLHQVVEDMLR